MCRRAKPRPPTTARSTDGEDRRFGRVPHPLTCRPDRPADRATSVRLRLLVANRVLRVFPKDLRNLPTQIGHACSIQVGKALEAEIVAPHPRLTESLLVEAHDRNVVLSHRRIHA